MSLNTKRVIWTGDIKTLKKIKEINRAIPVVMITKNEEEWLMDEAIASLVI